MSVRWTRKARAELQRLETFLAPVDLSAAERAVKGILTAVRKLGATPRLGIRLTEFDPREVRRIVVGDHEVRYELTETGLVIVRLWHLREDR